MSFAVFNLYIVFTFLRPFEFVPEGEQYRPMLVLWAIAFVLALFAALRSGEQAAHGVHYRLLLAFFVSIFLSSLARVGIGYAAQSVGHFSASAMLMVLTLLNVTTLRRLRIACITISLCMLVLAVAGIVSYHTGWNSPLLVLRQDVEGDFERLSVDPSTLVPAQDRSGRYLWRLRSVGFLSDPNDFAQALVFTLPLLVLTVGRSGRVARLLRFGAPAATLGYATALTHSRGAIVGIGVMLLLALRRVLGGFKSALLTGLVAAGGLLTGFGGGRAFSSQEQSAAERIEAWWVGINLLKTYPMLGAGYGQFTEHHGLTAHNSYVLCFAELGLLGLFIWLGMIVLTYRGLAASEAAGMLHGGMVSEAQMASLLKASLVGALACCWFLSRTYAPFLYMLMGLAIGARHCASKALQARQLEPMAVPRWRAATACACVACVLVANAFVIVQGAGR
jgi:hypothetical protein